MEETERNILIDHVRALLMSLQDLAQTDKKVLDRMSVLTVQSLTEGDKPSKRRKKEAGPSDQPSDTDPSQQSFSSCAKRDEDNPSDDSPPSSPERPLRRGGSRQTVSSSSEGGDGETKGWSPSTSQILTDLITGLPVSIIQEELEGAGLETGGAVPSVSEAATTTATTTTATTGTTKRE